MRVPLIKFLDRVIGQDDMVAVMTPEMSAKEMTFGRKTTVHLEHHAERLGVGTARTHRAP
jgi:hypothetical protein